MDIPPFDQYDEYIEHDFAEWLINKLPDKADQIKEALYSYLAEDQYFWLTHAPKEAVIDAIKNGSILTGYRDYDLLHLFDMNHWSIGIDYLESIFSPIELTSLFAEYTQFRNNLNNEVNNVI